MTKSFDEFIKLVNEYAYIEFMYRANDMGVSKQEYRTELGKSIPVIYLICNTDNHIEVLSNDSYSVLRDMSNRNDVYKCIWSNIPLNDSQIISFTK